MLIQSHMNEVIHKRKEFFFLNDLFEINNNLGLSKDV
jgi:hypothetical protein